MRSELRKIENDLILKYNSLINRNYLTIRITINNDLKILLLNTYGLNISYSLDDDVDDEDNNNNNTNTNTNNSIYNVRCNNQEELGCSLEIVKQYVKEIEGLCIKVLDIEKGYRSINLQHIKTKVRKKKINNIIR